MSTKLARKAIALFSNKNMPKATRRKYQREWLAQVSDMGKKWLLATPVKRRTNADVLTVLDAHRVAQQTKRAPKALASKPKKRVKPQLKKAA